MLYVVILVIQKTNLYQRVCYSCILVYTSALITIFEVDDILIEVKLQRKETPFSHYCTNYCIPGCGLPWGAIDNVKSKFLPKTFPLEIPTRSW